MSATPPPAGPSAELRVEMGSSSRGGVRVALAGEIDLATRGELQAGLLGILAAEKPRHMEVDLAGVTFMSCAGLTVLIIVGKAAADAGCPLWITNPQPIVLRILDLTGLAGLLTPVAPQLRAEGPW
jgi:anti-anti-sigma factor